MKYLVIGLQILFLYVFAMIGDMISSFFHLPIPGSIIGMLLLLLAIHYHIIPLAWIARGSDLLLKELLLFFIPSAVAIIQYRDILKADGIEIITILFISTVMVILFTGIVAEKMEGREQR
ncbi:CidA/LrgA family protein [Ectobacillus polymachus]|uniref:CidA/LrgA family protein n=1 Tax=Ectobacillus polymachus TaxID=1508806 RepID=UPI003A85E0A3